MQNLIYDEAPYDILYYDANLDAYRNDRFAGWQNMPADGTPLFTYGPLGYTLLTDATAVPAAHRGARVAVRRRRVARRRRVRAPSAQPGRVGRRRATAPRAAPTPRSSSGWLAWCVVVVVGGLVYSRRTPRGDPSRTSDAATRQPDLRPGERRSRPSRPLTRGRRR